MQKSGRKLLVFDHFYIATQGLEPGPILLHNRDRDVSRLAHIRIMHRAGFSGVGSFDYYAVITIFHATTPKTYPTPAVIAMAMVPQKVTRMVAFIMGAPPAFAPMAPRMARNTKVLSTMAQIV